MNESGNVVTARGLSKHFGDFSALDGVNFDIRPGSIVGLLLLPS